MTPLPLANWDLTQYTITFGGRELQGFADGDLLSITPPTGTFKSTVGGDGTTVVSRDPSRVHVIKLTLQRTSGCNVTLGTQFAAQLANSAGGGQPFALPFTCRNIVTGETWRAASAWITESPAAKIAKELPTREWTIEALMDVSPDR